MVRTPWWPIQVSTTGCGIRLLTTNVSKKCLSEWMVYPLSLRHRQAHPGRHFLQLRIDFPRRDWVTVFSAIAATGSRKEPRPCRPLLSQQFTKHWVDRDLSRATILGFRTFARFNTDPTVSEIDVFDA